MKRFLLTTIVVLCLFSSCVASPENTGSDSPKPSQTLTIASSDISLLASYSFETTEESRSITDEEYLVYAHDEIYEPKLTNSQLADRIKYKGWANAKIKADCSEPKSIKELRDYGIKRVYPCKKGADSLKAGIRRLQDYQLIVHPTCTNTIIELNNYAWDVKDGLITSKPIDDWNHLMDAMRYGSEEMTIKKFSW